MQSILNDDGSRAVGSSSPSSSSLAALSQTLIDRLNYQLTGTPSILSCDISRWTMLRLRHCVWQQISRMILHDSEPFKQLGLLHSVVELIKEVEIKGDLKKQFEFSRLLPLRLVTQFGAPRWNSPHNNNSHEVSRYHQNMAMNATSTTTTSAAVNGDSILGPAVAEMLSIGGISEVALGSSSFKQQQLVMNLALDKVLGETLPEDKNITLGEYNKIITEHIMRRLLISYDTYFYSIIIITIFIFFLKSNISARRMNLYLSVWIGAATGYVYLMNMRQVIIIIIIYVIKSSIEIKYSYI